MTLPPSEISYGNSVSPLQPIKPAPVFPTAGRHLHAFTLIEMLVVVAIIGILAAMLAPALRSAHRQSIALSCKNTMRNLGLMANDYLDAYRTLPPYCDGSYRPPYARWQWFFAKRIDANIPSTQMGYGAPSVYQYFTCPALESRFSLLNFTKNSVEVHFAINTYMYKKSFQRLRMPSKRCLIGEPVFSASSPEARYDISNTANINGSGAIDDDFPRHHKQQLSPVLFTDGHVENVIAPFVPESKPRQYIYNNTDYEKYYFWGNKYTD